MDLSAEELFDQLVQLSEQMTDAVANNDINRINVLTQGQMACFAQLNSDPEQFQRLLSNKGRAERIGQVTNRNAKLLNQAIQVVDTTIRLLTSETEPFLYGQKKAEHPSSLKIDFKG